VRTSYHFQLHWSLVDRTVCLLGNTFHTHVHSMCTRTKGLWGNNRLSDLSTRGTAGKTSGVKRRIGLRITIQTRKWTHGCATRTSALDKVNSINCDQKCWSHVESLSRPICCFTTIRTRTSNSNLPAIICFFLEKRSALTQRRPKRPDISTR